MVGGVYIVTGLSAHLDRAEGPRDGLRTARFEVRGSSMGRVLTRGCGTDVETCDFFYLGRGAAEGGGRFGTLTGWGWMHHVQRACTCGVEFGFLVKESILLRRHSCSRAGKVALIILLLLA